VDGQGVIKQAVLLPRSNPVPRIQPRNLVGFGQAGIIEGVVDKKIDHALEVDDGLPDMDKFGLQLRAQYGRQADAAYQAQRWALGTSN
jgi:hypothetical protein